ncbi:armadillo repeat protein [Ilyonectria robusta]|uniref:armadillo repeat protein n=1 Tax=Ilyonectria robusta TaxID=1079257 RepID=UPI001E8CD5C3|nr:armadillo repeat protein [Ilyonectria robusta]KAH8714370.1 armadillo repeat protein [Ilyonectria robusta]
MARPQSPPILSQLRSARTLPEQAAALRALKNEIVGHIQKKELWISLGVLDPIVRTLATARSPAKPNGKDARFPQVQRHLSEEESVRLQALQLVACFAHGGPAFLAPLHAARALPALLANISPFTNAPHLVVAALRALTDIADASALAPASSPFDLESLADAIFSTQYLESFGAMLSISSTNHLLQSQVPLAAGLISRLCREDRHQHALATAGILDALATRLASVAVARGHVVPGADVVANFEGLFEAFPEPAPKSLRLRPILEAIAAIIGDSKYRTHRLANSPSILAVFPPIKFERTGETAESKQDQEYPGFGNPRQQPLTAMEYILPINISRPLSTSPYASGVVSDSQSSSRSSLSKFSSSAIWDSPRPQPAGANLDGDSAEVESPFVPWLVYLVRSSDEYERLLASSILAALIKCGVGSKSLRETTLGLLVVPLLVDMVAKNDKDASDVDELDSTKRTILEQAPVVLARMVVDSDYLQKSAYDCDAVKVLSKLLKHAYTPVQNTTQPRYWSPLPDTEMDVEDSTPLTQLGEDGQNSLLIHRLKVREGTLKAIAALAGGSEDYRKAFLAEEIVSYVVESLSEFPRKPKSIKERTDKTTDHAPRQTATAGYGANPAGVIIAGCHVVRMLSRSVSTLRTALVDHGVALPVFRFMKHPDVNIQIAATATIINLVVEVSPVRELLTENGVMKVLCEHAHSDNPALRLNALWALKHFVDAVGPELKKACLEKLGTEYLVQLICDDTEDSTLHMGQERETSGIDMDDDIEMEPSDVPHRWLYASNGLVRELDSSRSTKLRQAEDKLAAVRESELNPVRRARNDDLAIQEQGLNFIQNLIGRPEAGLASETTSETAEMVDHLFNELGQDRMFEILASKLRAKVLHPFSRRTPVAGRETRVLHPQAKIIMAVIYILVHMAASIPRHRQLVIAQTELLKLLAQQASSKDREVRVALCHLIINLTWQEDDGEAQSCAQRAQELRKLGFHTKMETLKHQDGDLDVRERAKTAVWQIQQATY